MDKKRFKKGGLIKPTSSHDDIMVYLQPGVTYVSRATAAKYGKKLLRRLNGSDNTDVVVYDEPDNFNEENKCVCENGLPGGITICATCCKYK